MSHFSKIFATTLLASGSFMVSAPVFAEAKPTVIRLASPTVGTGNRPVSSGTFYATSQTKALLESEFKKDGIKIQWNNFKGAGPAINESFANNLVDVTWLGDLPAIIGKSSGLNTKVLLISGTKIDTYVAVPAGSSAKSLQDLKGKRVAIHKGTTYHLAAIKVLKKYGLTERDFRFVNMDTHAAQAALASGDIDAVWSASNLLTLEARGVAKIVYSTVKEPDLYGSSGYVLVNSTFEQKYPETVQRIVDVLVQEAAWESDPANKTALLKAWAQAGTPFAILNKAYANTNFNRYSSPLFDDYAVSLIKHNLKAGQELKLIRGTVDVDKWIEPKYLNNALKKYNLTNVWKPLSVNGT